jgi:hypothetical protein
VSDAIIYNQILKVLDAADAAGQLSTGLSQDEIDNLTKMDPNTWAESIPKLDDTGLLSDCPDGTAGVFCVWDPSYNRCQSTCTWVVPAGVTKAGFQLWGGGGGSSSGCCCGGHPGGSTGEFVSVIMDVTPGDSYILCNGCNNCCLGRQGGIQLTSGISCVTGPGITTLCAKGGCGTLCSWSCSIANGTNAYTFGFDTEKLKYLDYSDGDIKKNTRVCRMQSPYSPDPTGGCFCNSGYDYCTGGSRSTQGIIPYIISHCTPSTTAIDSARNPECGFIPIRWNAFCFNVSHYGFVQYAPTVCFGPTGPTTQKAPNSDCCFTFTSGNCCGGACSTASAGMASALFACMPGHGAVFSHAMGGGNTICGDTGRGAAIRVTYC